MGIQCGGWSVGWRGRRGDITPGTTIRKAIEKVVGAGAHRLLRERARAPRRPTWSWSWSARIPTPRAAAIAPKLELGAPDLALVEAAKRSGKPVVVVLISGRPLILGDVLDAASAVVAAWLPGTEGDGRRRRAVRRVSSRPASCPCSWPANMSQIPINVGDPRARAAVPVRLRPDLVSARVAALFAMTALGAGSDPKMASAMTITDNGSARDDDPDARADRVPAGPSARSRTRA